MQKEEIRIRIKEYLNANNKPCEDDDVDNYIYLSAYNKLMVDMYGASPFDRAKKEEKNETPTLNETKNEEVKNGNLLSGRISVVKK